MVDIFKTGGGEQLADEMHVSFLGSIPIDPSIAISADARTLFVGAGSVSVATTAFTRIASAITDQVDSVVQPCGA